MKLLGRLSPLVLIIVIVLAFSLHTKLYADEIEEAPYDPTVSDICTPGGCSPAEPCGEKDEMCYTINGAFYCCVEPPGGAEAVGE